MNKTKLFLMAGLTYVLCSSSAWVNLTLVRPSELSVPDYIKSIALIDRSQQVESTKNKVEQVLTGEVFRQDEQAVIKLGEGFIEACSGTQRFVTVRTTEKLISDGTKSTFPTPLDWNTVTDLCSKNQTDALLSIEIFDTDFILTNSPIKVNMGNNAGGLLNRIEFRATGVAVINLGIRLYDAANRVILDEYQTTYRINFDAQGLTLQAALNSLLDKVQATNRASYEAGFQYGQRITPTYYQATRYFFDAPRRSLGTGVRYSEVGDWRSAIDAWTKVVNNEKRRRAGRAAFDIAVAYEVLGDMEMAKQWAARSHTEFREKEADDYYKLLCNRIIEERVVNQQMPEETSDK
jgi:hypothetical protein